MVGGHQLFQIRVEIQLLDGGLEGSEEPNGETDATGGLEDINAAAGAMNGLGEIKGAAFEELRPLILAQNLASPVEQQFARHGFAGGAQGTPNSQGWREPGFQVQIAGAVAQRLAY